MQSIPRKKSVHYKTTRGVKSVESRYSKETSVYKCLYHIYKTLPALSKEKQYQLKSLTRRRFTQCVFSKKKIPKNRRRFVP